jgi:hypothetical protein
MKREYLKNCSYQLISIILQLLTSGCTHFSADINHPAPAILPEAIKASYTYPKFQGEYQSKTLEQNSSYTLQQITFPSNHNSLQLQHEIMIDYYAIDTVEKSPIILVLPILGGNNNVASIFAGYFAEHGFATAIVHRQNSYKKIGYLKNTNQIMRQIIFDHKQAIDWIESRPELDASRIGVFGVSMGGIKSALISALDPRIRASVIALAAGDLPYILAYTDEKRITKERELFLAEKKITAQQLEQTLSGKIECDPINYAQYIDADRTLMILAYLDTTVPYRKGIELKEKIGNPETIYLLAGHYSAILYLPYVKYQSRKFFQRQLQ